MPEKKPLSKNLVTRECTGCDKKCPAILLECWNVAAAWQKEFPQEDGAWWFFGVIPQETDKTLTIMVVRKTVNVPPQSFAFWNGHFWTDGDIEGQWQRIPTPAMPS